MEAPGRYSLRLFSAHPADSGTYRCIVSIFAGRRDPGPSSPASVTQRSNGVSISFTTKEVRVTAAATLMRGPLLKRGDTVTLLCNVTVTTTGPYQVEVQWFRKREEPGSTGEVPPGDGHAPLLAAVTHDGLSRLHGNFGDVSVDQPEHGYYRLRIHGAEMQDQGYYTCQAEVWGQDPHGAWYSTGVAAKSMPVNVYLYSRAIDLLLIPLVVGVSSALFVGVVVAGTVTCCFMNHLARRRSQK